MADSNHKPNHCRTAISESCVVPVDTSSERIAKSARQARLAFDRRGADIMMAKLVVSLHAVHHNVFDIIIVEQYSQRVVPTNIEEEKACR